MDVRVEKIITAFVENGWELVGILDVSQDWWFQDIILLESTWKPVGKKLYLTLGTDPALIQKKVWCVNITSEMPENRNCISLSYQNLSPAFAGLALLRSKFPYRDRCEQS